MHLSIDLTKLLEMQLTSSIGRETSGHVLFLFDGARHLLCCKIEYQLTKAHFNVQKRPSLYTVFCIYANFSPGTYSLTQRFLTFLARRTPKILNGP